MDYVKPYELTENVAEAGAKKAEASIRDILLKSAFGGALLGFATTLAFTAAVQTGLDVVGAMVFPAGFIMILLLNMELVTGNFAMVPLALYRNKTTTRKMLYNFSWAFIGNVIGGLFYAVLYVIYITHFGNVTDGALIDKVIQVAESKTLAYKEFGADGLVVVFVKSILCNWMVTLGAVMFFTSTSTIGKIGAMWLPIFMFFAQGFEHAVVNMFVIPAGILVGADITVTDWWLWNQIPVTIGNFISGAILTALVLHLVTKKK